MNTTTRSCAITTAAFLTTVLCAASIARADAESDALNARFLVQALAAIHAQKGTAKTSTAALRSAAKRRPHVVLTHGADGRSDFQILADLYEGADRIPDLTKWPHVAADIAGRCALVAPDSPNKPGYAHLGVVDKLIARGAPGLPGRPGAGPILPAHAPVPGTPDVYDKNPRFLLIPHRDLAYAAALMEGYTYQEIIDYRAYGDDRLAANLTTERTSTDLISRPIQPWQDLKVGAVYARMNGDFVAFKVEKPDGTLRSYGYCWGWE